MDTEDMSLGLQCSPQLLWPDRRSARHDDDFDGWVRQDLLDVSDLTRHGGKPTKEIFGKSGGSGDEAMVAACCEGCRKRHTIGMISQQSKVHQIRPSQMLPCPK